MSGIVDDVRISLRGLAKHRGFTLAAVLSVALGAGANTTVFTLLNAVLLRPLPVKDPGGLAALFTVDAHNPGKLLCSYPNYKDYRDRNQDDRPARRQAVNPNKAVATTPDAEASGIGITGDDITGDDVPF